MITKLHSFKEVKYRVDLLNRIFSFAEKAMNRKVSKSAGREFNSCMERLIEAANELKFLMTADNKLFADEIFKSAQNLFRLGNKMISNEETNQRINEFVTTEAKKMEDALFVIANNPNNVKERIVSSYAFNYHTDYYLNKGFIKSIFEKISVRNKGPEKFNIYFDDLKGGQEAIDVADTLNGELRKDFDIYGVDSPYLGKYSEKSGINVAKAGIQSSSKEFVDIAVIDKERTNVFGDDMFTMRWVHYISHLIHKRILKKGALVAFMFPFYLIPRTPSIMNKFEFIDIVNTGDEFGNLLFISVYKPGFEKSLKQKQLLNKATYMPHKLKQEIEPFTFEVTGTGEPNRFLGVHIGYSDVTKEFENEKSIENVLFENEIEASEKIEITGAPLQDIKQGHIPTLATTGMLSGRYADEVLTHTLGRKFGFDHLFETKIIKKEVEEKEVVDRDGKEVTEISLKKSNIIMSVVLTPQGEIIELFNNEKKDDE